MSVIFHCKFCFKSPSGRGLLLIFHFFYIWFIASRARLKDYLGMLSWGHEQAFFWFYFIFFQCVPGVVERLLGHAFLGPRNRGAEGGTHVCLSISINLYTVWRSLSMSVLSVCLSISINLYTVCLSIYLYQSLYCLSVYLSLSISILSVCLSISINLYTVCLSISIGTRRRTRQASWTV